MKKNCWWIVMFMMIPWSAVLGSHCDTSCHRGWKVFETFGDIGQYALPLGVGMYALYRGHYPEVIALGAAAGVQQYVIHLLKKHTHCTRPYPHQKHQDSFPSGHAARAFLAVGFAYTLDYVLSKSDRSFMKTPSKLTVLALAILVGISRLACQWHWPTDVAAGAALGTFFGASAAFVPYVIRIKF